MVEPQDILTFSSGATATVHRTTDRVLVTVVGDVDPCFAKPGTGIIRLLAEQGTPVDVDLSGVVFFSAAGAGWLASLYSDVGAEVRVIAASVVSSARVRSTASGDSRRLAQSTTQRRTAGTALTLAANLTVCIDGHPVSPSLTEPRPHTRASTDGRPQRAGDRCSERCTRT